ncbi:MAG: macrolide family glycosyltransferase [Syntrophothermus sp.]
MDRERSRNRLVFFNLPASGHVNPTLPLVAELSRRGASVLYYTGDQFRDQVERQGAEFRSYGRHLTYDHSRLPSNYLRVAGVLARATEDLLPFSIAELRRERPAVVISDAMCPWGRLAAGAEGIPGVSSLSALPLDLSLLRKHTSPAEFARAVGAGAAGYLRFRRASRRLRRTYHVEVGGLFDLFVYRDRLTIAYTTRAFHPNPERFDESVRFVGPLLRETEDPDPGLMRSLADGPLVYASMGTVVPPDARFLRTCVEAFADRDETLLLSVGVNIDPASLGPIPRNCIVRRSVPQLAVLRRTSVFITHGGMNSVSEGLALGVPLLLYPQSPEQGIIAARVAELGAGRTIDARDATPAGIRAAADAVLSGPYGEKARSLARDLESAGGAPAAADAIEATGDGLLLP